MRVNRRVDAQLKISPSGEFVPVQIQQFSNGVLLSQVQLDDALPQDLFATRVALLLGWPSRVTS